MSMGYAGQAEAWADAVRHGIGELEQATAAADWVTANTCAQALNDQLAAPPRDNTTLVLAVYLQTQPILARVASSAAAARGDAAQAMRQVTRGRKAINAYS